MNPHRRMKRTPYKEVLADEEAARAENIAAAREVAARLRKRVFHMPNRVLFEIPTDSDLLYRDASLKHIPRVGEQVFLEYPEGIHYDNIAVEAVMHNFGWGCVVVILEEHEMDKETKDKFIADGWVSIDDLRLKCDGD